MTMQATLTSEAIFALVRYYCSINDRNLILPFAGVDHGFLCAGFYRLLDENTQAEVQKGLIYTHEEVKEDLLTLLRADTVLCQACIFGLKKEHLLA